MCINVEKFMKKVNLSFYVVFFFMKKVNFSFYVVFSL